jgi:hypothetical protein
LISLSILGQRVRIDCADKAVHATLDRNFEGMATHEGGGDFDIRYQVAARASRSGFTLVPKGQPALACEDLGDVLYSLQRHLIVELQRRRADLLFLHAACLERGGNAFLMAGASGSGKSTMSWGLLHHGFRYLSDELSPIGLGAVHVWPYPQALKLRNPPVRSYPLPKEAIRLDRTIHLPVRNLPGTVQLEALPLGAVFLLVHRPELRAPEVHALGAAEASARLYCNALNALAHPNHGLDAVVHIAERVPCFSMASTDLAATCEVISGIA